MQSYVQLDDGQLFYSVTGEGEPLVLLHGNFNDHQIWQRQVNYLSQYYKVIAYDLRGYGQSSTPKSPFSNVEDLKTLINELQLDKVTLLGSSSGGATSVDFTLTYPNQVQSLILVTPSINGNYYPISMTWQGIRNYLQTSIRGRTAAIESFIEHSYWQYFFPSHEKAEARSIVLNNVRNENNFCRFAPKLSTPVTPYAMGRLQEINVPTLILSSDEDHPYNIRTARSLCQNIEQAEDHCFIGCRHLPFVEEPEQFNAIVHNFIQQHP
jgi:pimeloyl-ACP methyl ester carboxylesterase